MNIIAERRQFQTEGAAEIAGVAVICDRRGALFVPGADALVVSDLHLEKGSSHARFGRMLPPYDTHSTLALLAGLIADYRPAIVISLGDSFHDKSAAARLCQTSRACLHAMMTGREWIWITGNHDPDAGPGLGGIVVPEIALGGLVFRHEPSDGPTEREVAGHLHPGATLIRRGRAVRRRCFAGDGARMILPALGAYTGMLDIAHPAYKHLFCWDRFVAHMLGEGGVHAIAGRHLRK